MFLWILLGIAGFFLAIRIIYQRSSGRCSSINKLHGKTVIITGASAGIGKAAARDLAERGARIIMACRNVEKARKVADDIQSSTGNTQVIVHELELSSLVSVRKFAKKILETEPQLHILINNAGIAGTPDRILTDEGLELTMATNHYGHFLLTNMLLGLLKKSAPSRIISVSSLGHFQANSFDLNDLCYKKEPFPGRFSRYGDSKLANILFTRELAMKLRGTDVTANVLHPGFVDTEFIGKAGRSIFNSIFKGISILTAKDEKLGAQTIIYLAVADSVKDISGKYFVDCEESKISKLAEDDGLAKKFWEASERLVKLAPEEQHF